METGLQIQTADQFLGGIGANATRLLMSTNFDTGALQPMLVGPNGGDPEVYINEYGQVDQRGTPVVVLNSERARYHEAKKNALATNSGQTVAAPRPIPVTNAFLAPREWIELDTIVQRVARGRLSVVNAMRNAGLVRPNGGLGTMTHEYLQISEMTPANVAMNVGVFPESDRQDLAMTGVPIPIISKAFSINIRWLLASRRFGSGLDTTQVESATRMVAESIEDMTVNGNSTISVDGRTILGLRTATNRITGTATGSWTDALQGGRNSYDTVRAMIAALRNANFPGPYALEVGTALYSALDYPLDQQMYNKTVRQMLMEMPEVQSIDYSMKMPAGEAVLYQLTSDVLDLSLGADIQVIQWQELNGMLAHFMVFAAMAPRIKSDYYGHCGVAHYTGC